MQDSDHPDSLDQSAKPLPILGPSADAEIAERIDAMIRKASKIVITGHERPDGDCIGSEVALCLTLREAGYHAQVINSDPTPVKYTFLDPTLAARQVSPGEMLDASLVIVLDSPDLSRLGKLTRQQFPDAAIIGIDHHLLNANFGSVNFVDTGAAATGELVWRLASCRGWKVPHTALPALYAAIMTDTGQFAYSNTTPRVLRMAAELVERGVSAEKIWRHIYLNKSHAELQLEARTRASLSCSANGRICTISVTHADFQATGTGPQDTEEFVSIPRSLAGVELAIFFYEIEQGKRTKASMRSTQNLDVSALARKFGGGGHRQAAGCTLNSGLAKARELLLGAAEELLSNSPAS